MQHTNISEKFMKSDGAILLTRSDITALLDINECMTAVELAFKMHAEGKTIPPGILGMHVPNGGFHVKTGVLELSHPYFAAKVNGNFPGNIKQFGLPTIQGIIVLCDAENGLPLALMDSMEITIIRTGAATGIATRYLARSDAKTATICGCGNQGSISLKAITQVRDLTHAYAYDLDDKLAGQFAAAQSDLLGIKVEPVNDLAQAVQQSDICVTCTPSKQYFIDRDYVTPGTFIAAVGADSEDKQELDPSLLASSKVVVDSREQCSTIGELHHALKLGLITLEDVYAELGEIIAGKKAGRASESEITIFDSTGVALQDVASAAIVYEKALRSGMGARFNVGG
jgi:alanine dehydrogenase